MLARLTDLHGFLRATLLGLVLVSIGGLALELFLLEHTENREQLVPLVALAVAFAATLVFLFAPSHATITMFRVVMLGVVGVGVLGLWFHYRGNAEFELEMMPGLRGRDLFLEAIRGATPALAPGAIAQLGLLGFVLTLHHPRAHDATTREMDI